MLGMIDNFYCTVFVLDGAFFVAEMFRDFFQGAGYILKTPEKRDRSYFICSIAL